MDDARWQEAKRLFARALEVAPERRAAWIGAECEDEALRLELLELLAAHEELEPSRGGAPRVPGAGDGPFDEAQGRGRVPADAPGTTIGRYKLLQAIGEGGFGVVYMAEQSEPVRRKVALKVLKLGMDTKQVVARFEAERQALALMDHPNIAKVLDGGETPAGRPYFVMELVRGVPITEYCDQAGLDTRARLDLFRQVCHAVQHAHQKGIVHRDLKPSNVLVTLHDGVPVPKVIDFGVAKAIERHLTEKTLFTEFRQMVGTPEYMAPEQAELSGLDVDTRADVYSLGVLLYELLTGTQPFDMKTLLEKGYAEVLRTIREVDPPKPSTRLSTMGAGAEDVARKRHTAPKLLGRLVRGDLDWIVMKALEKDRSRRYDSANAFALDVQRFLDDEAVLASPPGAAYRARKYLRRHRLGAIAAGVVFAAFLASGVVAWAGMHEAETQAREEEEAAADATAKAEAARTARTAEKEQAARADAGAAAAAKEKARADTVVDFIRRMLSSADPHETRGERYTLRMLLDDFDRDLGTRLEGQPDVEASVRTTIGAAYLGLALPDKAEPHVQRVLALRRAGAGERTADFAKTLALEALYLHDRGDFAGARRQAGKALEVFREQREDVRLETATVLLSLADYDRHLGRYEDEEREAREAVALRRQVLGRSAAVTLEAVATVAVALDVRGRLDEAEAVLREGMADVAKDPNEDRRGLESLAAGLARVLSAKGEYAEAERLAREGLALRTKAYGDTHPVVATALLDLAVVLWSLGRLEEAEAADRRALALMEAARGPEHPSVGTALANLSLVLLDEGRSEEAEAAIRRALEISRRALGKDHPDAAQNLSTLGTILAERERYEEAVPLLREALALQRTSPGPVHVSTLTTQARLAEALSQRREHAEAERLARDVVEGLRRATGPRSRRYGGALLNLAMILQAKGDLQEAEALAVQAVEVDRASLGSEHPVVAHALYQAAHVHRDAGHLDDAVRDLREALGVLRKAYPGGHPTEVPARLSLFELLTRQGDFAGAESVSREALARGRSHEWLARLGYALLRQGKAADAEGALRECLAIREKETPDDWLRWNAASLLGEALSAQGKHAEAEPLLVKAWEGMASPPARAENKREALERIVALYEAWGKPEKAAEWRAKR
jgi:serine/threonine protein kinase/Flp pilus assembly protein TadD